MNQGARISNTFRVDGDEVEFKGLEGIYRTFIQNTSHELRTPLHVLLGYAELLRDEELGALAPEQREAVGAIADRAQEMRDLVERIGVLMAIEGGEGVSTPIDLGDLVQEIVEKRRVVSVEADLDLEFVSDPDLPLIVGGPYHLRQAVDSLIDNALKFTPAGGRVTVELSMDGDWIDLSVTDTGVGISEEELDRLFKGFYQVDGSSTRRHRGMGLGLTVVRAVVAEHGGQITVESQFGQGSRFNIRLPAAPPTVELEDGMDQAVRSSIPLRQILVVDDEKNVALAIRKGLEKLPGCEVAVASSGEEALALFEEHPFDLLITDYRMPGTDGMTLASRVQQEYPRTVTIIITAYSSEELRQRAIQASVQCILDKPVKLAEIRSVASQALAGGTDD